MVISTRDTHYPHYDHPHTVIISIFVEFLHKYFMEDSQVDYKTLDKEITELLNLRQAEPGVYAGSEYGESYSLRANWRDELSFDINNRDRPINGIAEFQHGSKYLALITSSDWEFFNNDCPYDFPAVFYSINEIKAWLVWALNKRLRFFPDHKERVTELIEKRVDVNSALLLMQKKLSGEEPWEFGPAREREPKMIVWHERTKNKAMNDWVRQWIE